MAHRTADLLNKLSTTDLKRLLAARERIDVLEEQRDELRAALVKIERELTKLIAGAASGRVVKKKTAKKKTAKKKTVRKKLTKKVGAKKATPKKATSKKPTAAKGRGAARKSGRPRLEDVIVNVIKKHGGPMAYRDLFAKVVKGKLFATRSDNFDNVMRRTLSTSTLVRRVARGVYDVA